MVWSSIPSHPISKFKPFSSMKGSQFTYLIHGFWQKGLPTKLGLTVIPILGQLSKHMLIALQKLLVINNDWRFDTRERIFEEHHNEVLLLHMMLMMSAPATRKSLLNDVRFIKWHQRPSCYEEEDRPHLHQSYLRRQWPSTYQAVAYHQLLLGVS